MSKAPPPVVIPKDFRSQPLEEQMKTLAYLLQDVDFDQNARRIHPSVAALRRWGLKSIYSTLQGIQQQTAAQVAPTPSTETSS